MCYREPLVEVREDDGTRWQYGSVTADKVDRLLEEHVGQGEPIEEWLVWTSDGEGAEQAFLDRQKRIVLRNCGVDRPRVDRRLPRRWAATRRCRRSSSENDPDGLINLDHRVRAARARRRRLPHRHEVALHPAGRRASRSTSSATPTRATRAPSWTARSWRAIRTRCSRAWSSPATPSAPTHGYIYVRAEYPMADRAAEHRHRPGRGARLPRRRHLRHRLRLPRRAEGGRRRLRLRRGDRPHRLDRGPAAACRGCGRPSRRSRACGAAPPTSTTSRPSPTCPGSS